MNKTAGKYHAVRRRKMSVIIILAVLLVLSMILALGIGSVFIPPTEVMAYYIGNKLLANGNAIAQAEHIPHSIPRQ